MLSLLLSLFLVIVKYLFGFSLIVTVVVILFKIWFEPGEGVCKCNVKLDGKVALITGGNSGIGLETAKALAKRGARVIIASRDERKSKEAVALIKQSSGNENVEYRLLNLAEKSDIQEFAKKFNEDFDRLDILVNNAGASAVKRKTTNEGVDALMQVNYVGPYMLTNLLLDKIVASKPSRIVNVSSQGHIWANLKPDDLTNCHKNAVLMRYFKTKLCNILWTKELAKRLPDGVTANVLHPGIVKTNIFDKLNPLYRKAVHLFIDLLFKTPEQGAQTIIHLCLSKNLANSTGGYYENSKEVKPSRVAQNAVLAEKLWHQTLALINH